MLAARLEAALGLLPAQGVLADIGAGDGALGLALAQRPQVRHVFATEYGEGAYQRLQRTCAGAQKVTALRGDGLRPLIGEPLDGVAVLGMGGRTILRILDLGRAFPQALFVLGPMQSAADLRLGLLPRGLAIVDERLVLHGGRPYPLIVARHGLADPLGPLDAVLGPVLRRTRPRGFRLLLERHRHLLEARLRGADAARRDAILADIAELEAEGDADL